MSVCQKLIEGMTGLLSQCGVTAALCTLRWFGLSVKNKSVESAPYLQPNLQSYYAGSFSTAKEGKIC